MLDASIPQTAAIKRNEARLSVEYDGKPEFEKIKGTSVAYAVNTGAEVLEIGGTYYAVIDGSWQQSDAAAKAGDKISSVQPTSQQVNQAKQRASQV